MDEGSAVLISILQVRVSQNRFSHGLNKTSEDSLFDRSPLLNLGYKIRFARKEEYGGGILYFDSAEGSSEMALAIAGLRFNRSGLKSSSQ